MSIQKDLNYNFSTKLLFVPLIYFFVSILWIISSDFIIFNYLITSEQQYLGQILKGCLFVILSTFIVYILVHKNFYTLICREKLFSSLFDNNPACILLIDPQSGTIQDANQAAIDFYGFDHKQLKSMSFNDLCPSSEALSRLMGRPHTDNTSISLHQSLANGELRDVEIYSQKINIFNKEFIYLLIFDTTERTNLQKKLSQSENRFRSAMTDSPLPLMIYAEDRSIQFISKKWMDLTGYTLEDIPTVDDWVAKAYPDRIDELKNRLAELFQINTHVEGSVQEIRVKNGDTRIWEFSSAPLGIENNQKLIISIAKDITQQKQMEAELQLSEQKFHTLINNIPNVAVQAYNADRTVIFWNKASELFYGYSKEEALGKKMEALILPEEIHEEAIQFHERWLNHDEPILPREWEVKHKNGATIPIYSCMEKMVDTKGNFEFYCFDIDLSELRKAQHDLEVRNHFIETILDNLPVGILVADRNTMEAIYINNQCVKIHDWDLETIRDSETFYRNAFPDEAYRVEVVEKINHWIKQYDTMREHSEQFEICTQKNETRIISLRLFLIDKQESILFITEDVTKVNELEQQLLQAQKLESIGHLAGGVAHDFNNILTAIMGYTSFAKAKCESDSPIYDDLLEINKSSERAMNLTRQLLAFSRKQIMKPVVLNLNDLIFNIDKFLRRLIGEDIEYVTIPNDHLWLITADPGQIEQIITNLAVNARDAMPQGGRLTIETKNVTLDQNYVSYHGEVSPGDYVMLAVTDTGTGIGKEHLPHIFEPFFTTKERGKGTGLGLSTVHGIVKQSGGSIFVYTEPGNGTSFKMYFPRSKESKLIGERLPECKELLEGSETVLVVEDDDMVRNLIVHSLKQAGYQVKEASYAIEAIELVNQANHSFDILITDVVLPKMSGKELAETLLSEHPNLKVLFISGYTDNAIIQHGILSEGINFLQKPFTTQSLLETMKTILNQDAEYRHE